MDRSPSVSPTPAWGRRSVPLRLLRVARSQLHSLSFAEFLAAAGRSLFRNDPILVYVKELDRPDAAQRGRVRIEKGCIEELEATASALDRPPWEFQCHRYDGVSDFFVVKSGTVFQHISWIYYWNDPNRILSLGKEDAEVKYCLTLPAFRGRGLYPATLRSIASFLRKRSFRRLFICVHRDNAPSIAGIEKAGFSREAEIRLRKALGIQISTPFTPKEVQDDFGHRNRRRSERLLG